jgi:hypothetical protein
MYVSDEEMQAAFTSDPPTDEPSVVDLPPATDHSPTVDETPAPEPPSFSVPDVPAPSFGDVSPPPSPFSTPDKAEEEKPAAEPYSFNEAETMYQSPVMTPFEPEPAKEEPSYNKPFEPEPVKEEPSYSKPFDPEPVKEEPSYNKPFDPEPVKEEPSYSKPFEPSFSPEPASPLDIPAEPPPAPVAEWSPPPAPDASWQNKEIGANTPFQPPAAGTGGLNQTLPIVSLVLGIISICCYISPLTGLAAIITGYMGMKNAKNDPQNFGGKGLAMAGMIVGGLFFLIGAAYYLVVILIASGVINASVLQGF